MRTGRLAGSRPGAEAFHLFHFACHASALPRLGRLQSFSSFPRYSILLDIFLANAVLPRRKLTEDFIQGAVPSREQVHASSGCRCSERSSSHAELSPLNFDRQDRDPFRLQWPPLVLWSPIISSCDTRVPTSDSAIDFGVRMKVGFPCRGHTRTSYVLYRS